MPKKCFDLEEAVSDWAWKQYDAFPTRKMKKLRQKDKQEPKKRNYIGLKIDWTNVKFTDVTHWQRLAAGDDDDVPAGTGSNDVKATSQDTRTADGRPAAAAAAAHAAGPAQTSPWTASVLFQTKFANNTDAEQEYTMRTEKTTRSSLSTCVENSYTKGFDLSVKLMTPCEVFEASAGYHRENTLTNSEGETFEEEMTWGVESRIQVKAKHVAEAKLVVTEKKQHGSFRIETTICGCVDISFTDVKDNNSLLMATSGDIGDIVEKFLERRDKFKRFVRVEGEDEMTVRITTEGTCKFRYGVKQEVQVDQTPIDLPPKY